MSDLIQTELAEAIADLQAKVPGSRIHISVHDAPFEAFEGKSARVIAGEGRSWLAATVEREGVRIELYSLSLPKAEATPLEAVPEVA